MASQIGQLLQEISRSIAILEKSDLMQAELLDNLREHCDSLMQRVSALESAERVRSEWSGEERRKVEKRLGTGDHTFKRLETKVDATWDVAEQALQLAQELQDALRQTPAKETSVKKRLKHEIVKSLVPLGIGFLWWLLMHLLYYGPKIAELMKRVTPLGEGGHP